MELTSSFNQTNFMGYCPPSQFDSSHYSNDGWKYHQEDTNSEHSNPWRIASEPQDEQENHEGYQPPPQNDSYHYPHGGWEYQQGMREYEQSSKMNYFPEPQSDSYYDGTYTNDGWEGKCNDSHSNYLRTLSVDCAARAYLEDCSPWPQNDPHSEEFHNSSSYDWEDQNQRAFNVSYSTYQEPSSLEQTFNSLIQNCPTPPPSSSFEDCSSLDYASTQSLLQDPYNLFHQPQNLFHNPQDSSHTTQNNFTTASTYPKTHSQSSSFELIAEDPLQKSRELLKRQEQLMEEQ
ncbi:hypothetical protein AHAS_Ahas09G0129300 [Arachis hypogaea]